jgi:hypothetical protein
MKFRIAAFGLLITYLWPHSLQACASCFGDPNSHLTIGAFAGVLFLLGVILAVLGAIFGVAIYWNKRARRLEVQSILQKDSTELR